MHIAAGIIVFVAVVTLVSGLSRLYGLPAPLILTVVGLVASFVPAIPDVELHPEMVLVGFLPPLLYAAALNTSLVDFRQNLRPIGLLSVGLVIVNTVVVGLVVWWLLPVPLAAGMALGAVVAPPDAVAASAVARRVGMPRRLVTILQGESLVNDATALVALRSATVAITGSVTVFEVVGDFVLTALGGLVVGVVMAMVTGKLRRHIEDEITDTAISLLTPFVAYLVAEEFDFSGVLAVVVTGIILSHKSHLVQSASSRIFERTNWRTIEFLLENTVFLLIGLQVREVLANAGKTDLSTTTIVVSCVAVTLTTMIVRPIWVFPATYLPRMIPSVARRDPSPPWTAPAAISWAGMRGVVTLAAAFVLPVETPYREVLILIALVVVGVTLLVQGSTLPWFLRRLGLRGPDAAADALQAASVQERATAAGLARLDQIVSDEDNEEVVERVRRRATERTEARWEKLGGAAETPSQAYARLRVEMIAAERLELIRVRDEGVVADDVLRRVIADIDVEETVLDLRNSWESSERADGDVLTSPLRHAACEHLELAGEPPEARTPEGCEECLKIGDSWVHLRLCMRCGKVGCCDSSPNKHATRHYHETGHPVIRSFEADEAWLWCFIDEELG